MGISYHGCIQYFCGGNTQILTGAWKKLGDGTIDPFPMFERFVVLPVN